ncbi:hypothetical protein [Sporomusa termitida]|uniref:PD-(D/E)XK nuclease family transposase n=1 Tax=Sporomusa termitida TaxID=2377 RepID=A0A517DX58_9FIRM|nr:hypothetical protein [Sporomusa termitida]QDR81945.1 hypothetical protein SPTER_33650 [Sporomusa termitida]
MDPSIREALQAVNTYMSNPQKRREYKLREKAIRDHFSSLNFAREEVRLEGKLKVAGAMLNQGFSPETVAQGTAIPINELTKLLEQ